MIIKYWKPILFSLFLLCIFGTGYFAGNSVCKSAWRAEQLKEAEAEKETQKIVTKKLADAEKEATDLRTKFRGLYASLTTNNCPAGDGVRAINQAVQLSR